MKKIYKLITIVFLGLWFIVLGIAILTFEIILCRKQILSKEENTQRTLSFSSLPPLLTENNISTQNTIKTVQGSILPTHHEKENDRNNIPLTHSYRTLADAHLGCALGLIGSLNNETNLLTCDLVPFELKYSVFKERGKQKIVDYFSEVPLRKSLINKVQRKKRLFYNTQTYRIIKSKIPLFMKRWNILLTIERWIQVTGDILSRRYKINFENSNIHERKIIECFNNSLHNNKNGFELEKESLYHLEKAAGYGNHHALNIIANTLASGILPVVNYPSLRYITSVENITKELIVSSDFSDGCEQLTRAIMFWHFSALDGNIEAAMSLGYRHRYSAMVGKLKFSDYFYTNIVSVKDFVPLTLDNGYSNTRMNSTRDEIYNRYYSREITHRNLHYRSDVKIRRYEHGPFDTSSVTPPKSHGCAPIDHYGVIGTCESALLYYEAAANTIMDELESSPSRGKVAPSMDNHILIEIHKIGASSALDHYNKPDELEEALQYYRMKSSRENSEPDVGASFTLASMYHYGLRGVNQDMTLALKYYEIAADYGSIEAAGQAGKFHLWAMGLDNGDRDMIKAYNYFRKGMPGGLSKCKKRFESHLSKKSQFSKRKDRNELLWNIEDIPLCDHPSINGMGLLHLFGIPMVVKLSFPIAKDFFNLARDMGNMDASYNLGMISLGWLKPTLNDNLSVNGEKLGKVPFNVIEDAQSRANLFLEKISRSIPSIDIEVAEYREKTVLSHASFQKKSNSYTLNLENKRNRQINRFAKSDFMYAVKYLKQAMKMGHIQAKHRLAMLYAEVIVFEKTRDKDILYNPTENSCPKALALFKELSDGGVTISRRLRVAYKQYVLGKFDSSLRNYLAAAETGSLVGQVNAAYLLELGYCLGMKKYDCLKASLRLWRAAARQGDETSIRTPMDNVANQKASVEACIKVGDFYYYGRLRSSFSDESISHSRDYEFSVYPYPWVRYIIFPEDLFLTIIRDLKIRTLYFLRVIKKKYYIIFGINIPAAESTTNFHLIGSEKMGNNQTCHVSNTTNPMEEKSRLAIAARYYIKAAEEHNSARANYNLGFMHEWGIGLAQDFPLAKRHYDLAAKSREAAFVGKIALAYMSIHEKTVRARTKINDWLTDKSRLKHSS